jgi:pyrroline-5-carboxylate reductase
MIKVGFIGYGSMGSMLLNEFITSRGLKPDEIIVSTRTKNKLTTIKEKWDQINIAQDNAEVAKKAKYIFVCVKQPEVKNVLKELKNFTTSSTHIISLAGSVSIQNIEKLTNGKVTKITPSITSEVHSGITLVCHNNKVTKEEADFIESLLSRVSAVKSLKEEDLELAIELTSCAPGFIAAIFREFVNASLNHNNTLSQPEIEELVIQTLFGTAKLFIEKNVNFEEVVKRVATKGGITEEGVKVINSRLPEIFDDLFEVTLTKRKKIKDVIDEDFLED